VALLFASLAVSIWPELPKGSRDAGVAVRNYIAQSAEFTICAAILLHRAVESSRRRHWMLAAAGFVLALLFLADIFFIATSRTTLVVIAVLILLYGVRQFGWKGFMLAAVVGLAAAAMLWVSSPYLRDRVAGVLSETETFEAQNVSTSSGERLMFWTRSIGFIESAPLLGHGTGSISEMFRRAAAGHTGARAEASSNPHNQTFAVAIQLGIVGALVLWAMWIAHLVLFRGGGLIEWVGLVIVVQNIVGSLFNSFLFDFTEGWLYVVGVGVAGGMVLKQKAANR
jgi:O-antigen ligase